MNIKAEIKEIGKFIDESKIEKSLIRNVVRFLGGEDSPLRNDILLSNQYEIKQIKESLLIATLELSQEEADDVIEKLLQTTQGHPSILRSAFYYLAIIQMDATRKKLENVHPGEVLQEEFLRPMQISAYRLSKDIGVPQTRISMILKGERGITADTALRLSKYFGTSSKFWLGLQNDYDLEESRRKNILDLKRIKKCA